MKTYITSVVAILLLGAAAVSAGVFIVHQDEQPFRKFLADNNCEVLVNFGKPVIIEAKNAMGAVYTPRVQTAYKCEKFPMIVLD